MEIIPVIDLLGGQVVHAREGRRESYAPLVTPLCHNARPLSVIEGVLSLYPFKTIYLADLDALMGKMPQNDAVNQIRGAYPQLSLWLDRGLPAWKGNGITPVIGSESLNEDHLPALQGDEQGAILSLDFRGSQFLGPPSLLSQPHRWPQWVILMSLSRVGANAGPDFTMAAEFIRDHPDRSFISAGGVRHSDDLGRLKSMGVAGVLLSSALHQGGVTRAALDAAVGSDS